jgi:hypothetical protein
MEALTKVAVTTRTVQELALGLFVLPADLCCNCGAIEGLSAVTMRIPHADLAGEGALPLPLPHCARCAPTARRAPPRLGRTLTFVPLFFFLSAVVIAGGMSLVGRPLGHDDGSMVFVLAAITALGLALPLILFRWRPPAMSGQTSRYQAVRVRLAKTFLGKVKEIEFSFTNPAYAERFRSAAQQAMAQVGGEVRG